MSLTAWSSFFTTTASSAAALTGLMFVVITLVGGTERRQAAHDGIATFSTPTVLHFCAALLASAVLCAPWRSLVFPSAIVGIAALYGIVHVVRASIMARRLTLYVADAEDWIWYTIAPFFAYAALLGGALALESRPTDAPFALGTGVLLLIFIGIHNAWDVVTFLATGGPDGGSGN